MILKPAPETDAEPESDPAPTFVTVKFISLVWPTVTVPKLRELGFTEITGLAATPVPDTLALDVPYWPPPADVKCMTSLKFPAPGGENLTVTVPVCPMSRFR